jgi:hypothetical protein
MSDLVELFARDPNSYSKQDIKTIISMYREKRKQFNSGGILAGKVKAAPAKSLALASAIKSDDLEI